MTQEPGQPASAPLEPELAPLMCVDCETEIEASGEPWPEACPKCGRAIDLETQFAYIRGRDAFIAGQDLLIVLTPKMRRRNIVSETELEGLQYYSQAYSALQRAFQGRLAETQRHLAIEMMAAMVQVFQVHGSISPFESGYWTALMMELTMQLEVLQVREKIDQSPKSLAGIAQRWRWEMRLKQLSQGLVQVNARIKNLERNIGFVERPKARRKLIEST
jgi:hypothetical protein